MYTVYVLSNSYNLGHKNSTMKIHTLHSLLFIGLGLLALNVNAQLDTQAEDSRSSRQSDFDFPGPRRQTPATLPVFHSGGGEGGRGRPRQFRPAPVDSGEGEVIDEGFQEQPPPPRQSFRGSGSSEGSRFSSRPQFSEDLGNEADSGGRVKGQGGDGLQEEKKEPEVDRLALLLQDSKFSCTEKKPGYYADDGLSCEVFHYCNDGVRHSWMCPAGTLFHQIHLICMQEGGDNICKQSAKYHFVNDYLYKPVSQATKENNGTIRYANRYFPDENASPNQDNANDGFQGDQQQPQHQSGQDDFSNFQEPSQGGFRQSRPQSEEQFFSPPPQRPSHDGGSRFRPSFDEGQFSPEPSQFSSGSRGRPQQHDEPKAFGSDEGSSFQPAPVRVRGRQGKRNQGFPTFSES